MTITRIHVNQHNIKYNRKHPDEEQREVLTCKTSKSNMYANKVHIDGPCHIVYRPEKPLSCGAHVWIETTAEVRKVA